MSRTALIRIDLASRVPAYEQIASEIRTLLVTAELQAGAPLPTVRQLATDLNVHHNTVAQAYRILADEGWLDLRRRRGVRVLSRSKTPRPRPDANCTFQSQLRSLLTKAVAEGLAPRVIARQLTLHARHVITWPSAKGE